MEIMDHTGRSKTSIYYHIKNIPLSDIKIQEIQRKKAFRINNLSREKKGKSKKTFKKFNSWDKKSVFLVSHFIFDGSINSQGCMYNNRNLELLRRVEGAMSKLYAFEPTRYTNLLTGVSRISYFNVALGSYIEGKATQLLANIESLSKNLKRELVRSFFDDEGCIDYRPKRRLRQVRGYQKDMHILLLIQKLLSHFAIESKISLPNEIVIRGKENLQKFRKEINFSPGVYINGNRSNSIWKQNLEKRVILDRAIKTFQISSKKS